MKEMRRIIRCDYIGEIFFRMTRQITAEISNTYYNIINEKGNADSNRRAQTGRRIFRQAKRKTQGILCVLPSIFAKYGGK